MKKKQISNRDGNASKMYAEMKKILKSFEAKDGESRKRKVDLFLVILGILISFFGIALPVAFFWLTWNIYDNFNKSHEQIIKMQAKVDAEWEQLGQKKTEAEKQYREILSALNNAKTQEKTLESLVAKAEETRSRLADQSNSTQKYILEQKTQIEKLSKGFNKVALDYLALQVESQAENELINGLYENAIAEYQTLFELLPEKKNELIFCANLGFAYFKCKNYEKSIACYTDALKASSDSAVIYISKACAELEFLQYDDAVQSAGKALEILERNIEKEVLQDLNETSTPSISTNRIGRVHLLVGVTKSNCFFIRAVAFKQKGDSELAQENFIAAIEHQPTNHQALYQYAYFLLEQKLYSKAERYLRQAVALESSHDILLGLAEVEVIQHKYSEALVTLDKIIATSQVPRAFELRAHVRANQQNVLGAYEDIVTFSDLSNTVNAFRAKMRLEINLGKYSEALDSINRAIKLDNQSSELQIHKIALLLLCEKYDSELVDSNILKINKMTKTPTIEHYVKIFSEINNQLKRKNSIDWDYIFDMNTVEAKVKNDLDLSSYLVLILKKYPVDAVFPIFTKWWYNTFYIQEKNSDKD